MHEYGIGVPLDVQRAISILKGLSASSPRAKSSLMNIYLMGKSNTHSDYLKALPGLEELANKENYISAQYNLGLLFFKGEGGVTQNFKQSYYYFKLASEQDDAESKAHLALFYLKGYNVIEPNPEKAIRLLHEAIQQEEYAPALITLANLYITKNTKLASTSVVTEVDSVDLEKLIKKDDTVAFDLFQRAVQQDYSLDAYYNLGTMHLHGKGTSQDYRKALDLLEYSGNKGHIHGAFVAAVLYANGVSENNQLGVSSIAPVIPVNYDESIRLSIIAAHGGHVKAVESLRNIFQKRTPSLIERVTPNYLRRVAAIARNLVRKVVPNAFEVQDFQHLSNIIKTNTSEMQALHLQEALMHDPVSFANLSFKESGIAIPLLASHFQVLMKYEERVISIIEDLLSSETLIDGWYIKKDYIHALRGEVRYYDEFVHNDFTYLALGQHHVEKAKILFAILRGDDQYLKASLESIKFLETILYNDKTTLLGKAVNLHYAARSGQLIDKLQYKILLDFISQQEDPLDFHEGGELVTFDKKEEILETLQHLQKIPEYLEFLLIQGVNNRNKFFAKKYPFLSL